MLLDEKELNRKVIALVKKGDFPQARVEVINALIEAGETHDELLAHIRHIKMCYHLFLLENEVKERWGPMLEADGLPLENLETSYWYYEL